MNSVPPDADDYPPFWLGCQALSEAATLATDECSDWAARSLRAARWSRVAEDALWPSLALRASTSVMECLFVQSKSEARKGVTIAERFFGLGARLDDHTSDSQHVWFVEQYRAGNSAVHEGISIEEELEVETVKDIARYSALWAIWHLRRFHGAPDNEVCEAFDEVFDADRHSLTLTRGEPSADQ